MTKAEFNALSDQDAFNLCFKSVTDGEHNGNLASTHDWNIENAAYQLEFVNVHGPYSTCKLCAKKNCSNCLVPYNETEKVSDYLAKLGLDRNDTLFEQDPRKRGKELICSISWHKDINNKLFDFMATASPGTKVNSGTGVEENKNMSNDIQLDQCLQDFKQSETLDEDNKWYCNKCQQHVQATKTLEIYRVPKIMIISLKRFKTSKNRYGYGGNSKVDTLVNFPLEGLDMRPFVLHPEQINSNCVYDCFGISNHFGSVGFGHYTAYCKNPLDGKWYDFDDSQVSPTENRNTNLVSDAAYNLFFRLRSDTTMENLNLDQVQMRPDMDFLN